MRKLFAAAMLAVAMSASIAGPPLLAGCSFFGVQRPQNFDEKVVAGYKLVETVADAVPVAFHAGKVSQAEANAALDGVQKASDAIGIAVDLKNSGDFSNAETRLNAAIAALELLQSQLRGES